ncbi:MAG: hypothetical protein PVF45_09270, partial [Anaerolineae bacterium]
MKNNLLFTVLTLTLLLTSCGQSAAPPTGTATPAAIAMAGEQESPFTSRELGLRSVAPEGWTQVEPGHFMRGVWPADVAQLVAGAYPGMTLDWLLKSLVLPTLDVKKLPESDGQHESATFSWNLYTIQTETPHAGRVVVDLALAETDTG